DPPDVIRQANHSWRTSTMKCPRLVTIGIMVLLTAVTAFGQQIDPAFRGVWVLNIEKSDFGGQPKPKMEQLNWTEHGWAFAMVRADGQLRRCVGDRLPSWLYDGRSGKQLFLRGEHCYAPPRAF